MTQNGMRIGQLADALGTTTKTLRFYERIGLLRPAVRSDAGYRLYDRTAMDRARLVIGLRRLEFSIDELQELLRADGKMTTLREGANGWLCMPDNPITPGRDPMCADKVAQDWLNAYMAKKSVEIKQIGIVYMLLGGTDASNTDPYATKPTSGNQWVKTPSHVMVLPPDPKMLESYPSEPSVGTPYVMWRNTPYAHLMVPVRKPR